MQLLKLYIFREPSYNLRSEGSLFVKCKNKATCGVQSISDQNCGYSNKFHLILAVVNVQKILRKLPEAGLLSNALAVSVKLIFVKQELFDISHIFSDRIGQIDKYVIEIGHGNTRVEFVMYSDVLNCLSRIV